MGKNDDNTKLKNLNIDYKLIAEKINKLIQENKTNPNQMCSALDISQATVSMFLKGARDAISLNYLYAIANYFNVPLSYFIKQNIDDTHTYSVRYFEKIKASAGSGELVPEDNYDIKYMTIDKEIFNFNYPAKDVFALRVSGDSMQPTLFNDDIVFAVDIRNHFPRFQPGVYIIEDDFSGIKVKRLDIDRDGNLLVISDNTRYLPQRYSSEDVDNGILRIIGKVIGYYSTQYRDIYREFK